jgi:hypothetical protein
MWVQVLTKPTFSVEKGVSLLEPSCIWYQSQVSAFGLIFRGANLGGSPNACVTVTVRLGTRGVIASEPDKGRKRHNKAT